MKKTILPLFVALLIISCDARISTVDTSQATDIKNSLSYFKDTATGLCFGTIQAGKIGTNDGSISITCVPCDSLKKVFLK